MIDFKLDTRYLLLNLIVVELVLCNIIPSSEVTDTPDSKISLIVLGTVCFAFLIVLVLAVLSCGGCNDMGGDVATENHPACGKPGSNFNPIVADANTSVLMSSHTMGGSTAMIPPQNLPYSLQPASTQGFTGYQSGAPPSAPGAQAPVMGSHRPVIEPPPPSYDQLNRQGSLSGYGY